MDKEGISLIPIILGINTSHNASATLTIDNNIVFHLEAERITNDKYSHFPHESIRLIKDYVDHVNAIAVSGFKPVAWWDNGGSKTNQYIEIVRSLGKSFSGTIKFFDYGSSHHLCHASAAFYNSGFDDALCIIKDGAGSYYGNAREQESNFLMSRSHQPMLIDRVLSSQRVGLGEGFEIVSQKLGFTEHDAGKVMGLAAYGKSVIPLDFTPDSITDIDVAADLAYSLQIDAETRVIEDIHRLIAKTGKKNICLSGGLFLNCVMNYKILDSLPSDINLYVEPISNDSGTSIGAARLAYFFEYGGNNNVRQNTIFYGPAHEVDVDGEFADNKRIAKLIADRNIVAVYQGGSEAGPRALGNRSILYDPRDKHGKDIVNTVKGREWFRPFAGSVLVEHADEWFDMKGLSESPYMMYAVDVRENKRDLIPSITHLDGTCRVQTVSEHDNKNFYEIIREFYAITKVPVVFNTSFNIAGDCLVETVDDALNTFYNSDIDVLYFPEAGKMIRKNHD